MFDRGVQCVESTPLAKYGGAEVPWISSKPRRVKSERDRDINCFSHLSQVMWQFRHICYVLQQERKGCESGMFAQLGLQARPTVAENSA